MGKRIQTILLLLISLLVVSSGCSRLKDPVRKVKFEILPAPEMPAGAKVKVIIQGDQTFLLDAPGSKEIELKAETKREIKVDICRLTIQEGPSFKLDVLRDKLKIYVDGKEISFDKAPGSSEFYVGFILESVAK